jgi:hypothetical protein
MPRKGIGDKRVRQGKPRQAPSDRKSDNKQLVQKRRAERNRARASLGLKKGDTRDAAHTRASKSGKLSGPVKAVPRSKNRSDNRKG